MRYVRRGDGASLRFLFEAVKESAISPKNDADYGGLLEQGRQRGGVGFAKELRTKQVVGG